MSPRIEEEENAQMVVKDSNTSMPSLLHKASSHNDMIDGCRRAQARQIGRAQDYYGEEEMKEPVSPLT